MKGRINLLRKRLRMSNLQPKFSANQIKDLSRVNGAIGIVEVMLVWGTIISTWALARIFHSALIYVISILIVASRQSALGNLTHEAWHGLCFKSRKLNDWIGAWLYSYPLGIPYYHDRLRHLRHHRLVGEKTDPDRVNYSNIDRETPLRLILFLIGRLLGSLLVKTVWSVISCGGMPIQIQAQDEFAPEKPLSVKSEFLRIFLTQILLALGMSIFLGWWGYLVLWLFPLSTICAFFNNFRAFVEHSAGSDLAGGDERLSDFQANTFERVFVSPCNFHFHALHHSCPTVPYYRLPLAKHMLVSVYGEYPLRCSPSYGLSFLKHLSALNCQTAEKRSKSNRDYPF